MFIVSSISQSGYAPMPIVSLIFIRSTKVSLGDDPQSKNGPDKPQFRQKVKRKHFSVKSDASALKKSSFLKEL